MPSVGRPACDSDDGDERVNRGRAGGPLHPRTVWTTRSPGRPREWAKAKASAPRRSRLCCGRFCGVEEGEAGRQPGVDAA